jgi:hypothetical protein
MTLIAGFKCQDGYVVCADSEVTVTDAAGNTSHVSRQKLLPLALGGVQVAIAGAGDGDLIEAFVARLEKNLKGTSVVQLDSIRQLICDEIKAFAKEKKIPPRKIPDYLRFLVAVHSPGIGSDVWKAITGDPIDVSGYALVGYEDTRYDYAVKNLYHPGMPLSQGVFLGLYLMWVAEQTTPCVKAPITVAIVKDGGISFEQDHKIDSLVQKVRMFTTAFESQFLACSDTGLQGDEFGRKLKEFGATVVQFREDFIAEWVGHAIDTGLDKVLEQWNPIPGGTTIVLDAQNAEHQRIQQMIADALRQNDDGKQSREKLLANLGIILRNRRKRLLKYENPDSLHVEELSQPEMAEDVVAFTELDAAVRMGVFKVSQEVVNLVQRVTWQVQTNLLFGEHIELQLQCIATQQAINFIERTMPTIPETTEGQQY